MSFNYDPERSGFPDDIERVRLKIGDTDSSDYLIEDEEIQVAIDRNPSITAAASAAAYRVAAKLARRFNHQKSEVSKDEAQLYRHYRQVAKDLEDELDAGNAPIPVSTGISVDDKDAARDDTDRVKPRFYRGAFDNPGDHVE